MPRDVRKMTDEELFLLRLKMTNWGTDFDDAPATDECYETLFDEMMKRKLINETSLHFFERGCQRLHAGDLNEAANSFCKAVEESPKFLDAYTNWGGCLLDLGKPKEALSVLHKGQEIGMTLDLGNNIDRAKAMLRKENE